MSTVLDVPPSRLSPRNPEHDLKVIGAVYECQTAGGPATLTVIAAITGFTTAAVLSRVRRLEVMGVLHVEPGASGRDHKITVSVQLEAPKRKHEPPPEPAQIVDGKPTPVRQRVAEDEHAADQFRRLSSSPIAPSPTCMWIEGESWRGKVADGKIYCGCRSQPGRSYCAEHVKRVYGGHAAGGIIGT